MCLGGRIHGRCCPPHPINIAPPEPIIVPLTGANASVRVVDYTAEVTIKQRYENQEKDPIEAVYEFPLDPEAAVVDFYAEIDDKKIIGTIKEKEKAKDTYDDAIASGHGAYLLEKKEDSNIFSASIGNLPPGKEVLIVIVYVTELSFDEGKLKLVLPANPYPPDGNKTPKFVLPKQNDTPLSKVVPYGLNINIDFDMTSNIRSIASQTHPIKFEFSESGTSKATVSLAQQDSGVPLGKDFELLVTLAKPNDPIIRLETQPNGDTVAMVALHPNLPDDQQIFTEMVFLVDRSGSMSGSRISQVRDTLQIFLRSLPEGTLFNIFGFGTKFEKLFPESKEYNESTLQTAVSHVEKMTANLGGTNLLSPLQAIFAEKAKEGIPRQLFVLTDGEVDNTQQCLDEVRLHSDTTRVFTFGIGADASKALVGGMAKQGNGQAEFVRSGESMDEKVLRQLNRALKPALVDLKVEWDVQEIEQTPYRLPPLFGGGRLVVYGFVPKGKKLPSHVTLHANTVLGAQKFPVTVNPELHTVATSLISKLATKSLIRDLEEARSCFHDMKGKLIKSIDVTKKITEISIAAKVISKYTAFVAVEKRQDATEGTMKMRKMEISDFLTDVSGSLERSRGSGGARGGSVSGGRGRGGGPVPPPSRSVAAPSPSQGLLSSIGSSLRSRKSSSISASSSSMVEEKEKKNSVPAEDMKKKEKSGGKSLARADMNSGPPPPMAKFSAPVQLSSVASDIGGSVDSLKNANTVREIIKTQRANGSFSLDTLKLFVSSANIDEVQKQFPSTSVSITAALVEIFVTVIVCQYFKLKFADQQIYWNLVLKKALSWVNKEAEKSGIGALDFESAAVSYLKSKNVV